jgi:hypothetical protein
MRGGNGATLRAVLILIREDPSRLVIIRGSSPSEEFVSGSERLSIGNGRTGF